MIKRYNPSDRVFAGGLLVETMSHDPDGEYIRVADLAQYVVALEVAVNDGDHAYSSLSADQVDQLRALLAAARGE